MPLYKPKFLTPGGENRTIDLQDSDPKGIGFSCMIDGNTAIKKYRVDIWSMANESTHFTKTVTLSSNTTPPSPFFPINEKNEYNLFQFYLSKTELSSAGIVNSTVPYKWQISMWGDGNQNNSTPDIVSCEEVFYGNKAPSLSIKYEVSGAYVPFNTEPLKSKVISFKGIYSQAQQVPMQRFGWYIKNITTDTELFNTIDDGKMVYGSSDNIVLTFDGFLNNEDYLVRCKAVTQNGAETEAVQEFSIRYDTYDITSDFTLEPLPQEAANLLSWSDVRAITGKAYNRSDHIIPTELLEFMENYPIAGQESVILDSGNKVVFEEGTDSQLDLPEDITVVYSGQFDDGKDRIVLEMTGADSNRKIISRKLEIKNRRFVYTAVDGDVVSVKTSDEYVFNSNNWFIAVLYPMTNGTADLRITNRRTVETLYPSASLFCGSGLFPKFGVWEGE